MAELTSPVGAVVEEVIIVTKKTGINILCNDRKSHSKEANIESNVVTLTA